MKRFSSALLTAAATVGVLASTISVSASGGSNTFPYPTVVEGTFTINTSKQAQKHIPGGDLTTLVAESDRLYSAKGCSVGVAVNMPRKYTCSGKVIALTYGYGNGTFPDTYMTWTQQ